VEPRFATIASLVVINQPVVRHHAHFCAALEPFLWLAPPLALVVSQAHTKTQRDYLSAFLVLQITIALLVQATQPHVLQVKIVIKRVNLLVLIALLGNPVSVEAHVPVVLVVHIKICLADLFVQIVLKVPFRIYLDIHFAFNVLQEGLVMG
jgi:hypothetical protein